MKATNEQINEVLASPLPISFRELSHLLGVTAVTIWRWHRTGLFKAVKIGGKHCVTKAEVRKLLKLEKT